MMARVIFYILLFSLPVPAAEPPTLAEKEAVAREVFDRLVAARGDRRLAPPTFTLSTERRSAAACTAEGVVLEEAAYDVCAGLEAGRDAALAAILSHELIHYYEGHTLLEASIGLVSQPGERYVETRADYLGGLLAHLAGYESLPLLPRVLEGIYRAYELPEQLTGYPTLANRKELAGSAELKLDRLLTVFDMGNILTALGRYGEAADYYTLVLREFPSRELYNNLGVLYLKASLPLFQPSTVAYVYPITLDVQTRLKTATRSPQIDTETRGDYLALAIDNLQRARLLDADYLPARINLAVALSLDGLSRGEGAPDSLRQSIAADRLLESGIAARGAERMAHSAGDDRAEADALLVRGILAALTQDTSAARRAFLAASKSPAARANLSLLETGALPAPDGREAADFFLAESFGDVAPSTLPRELPAATSSTLITGGDWRTVLQVNAGPVAGTQYLRHQSPSGSLVVCRTAENYTGETALQIGIGSALDDLVREYGSPTDRLTTVNGEWLVYADSELVVETSGGAVNGWFIYRSDAIR